MALFKLYLYIYSNVDPYYMYRAMLHVCLCYTIMPVLHVHSCVECEFCYKVDAVCECVHRKVERTGDFTVCGIEPVSCTKVVWSCIKKQLL